MSMGRARQAGMAQLLLACLAVCWCTASGSEPAAGGDLVIKKATRYIGLATHTVVITETLEVENSGSRALDHVLLCTSADHAARRAFFEVLQGAADDAPELHVQADGAGVPANVSCVTAALHTPLAPGKGTTLQTYAAHTKLLTPKPAEVRQDDVQRVVYAGNLFMLSPYRVESQTLKVKLFSKDVASFTELPPSSKSGASLSYGPYADAAPFSARALRVHYENNSPFAEVTALTREVEVSHWGNVYVEETYKLRHGGARLKGEWSRLEYQADPRQHGIASFRQLAAVLPRGAHSLYFRDEIGNVSTSHVRHFRDKLEVALLPRFPLFGGWSVDFVFGYSLPLSACVKRLPGGRAELTLPFSTPLKNVVVDDLVVRVVLPEGATDLKHDLPFSVDASADRKLTYLDSAGRPVLALHKRNLVPDHNVPLSVTYRMPGLHLLQEPLMLVSGFLVLFASVLAYSRLDLSL